MQADEFEPLRAFLTGRLDELKTNLVTLADPHNVRVMQGRAQELTDFLRLIEDARGTIERLADKPGTYNR